MRTYYLLFSLFIGAALAQAASLHGTVVDPSGAGVPRATVTCTRKGADERITTLTGPAGAFQLKSLSAGEYLVEAESEGLGITAPTVVVLTVGSTLAVDLKLSLGRLQTRVQVTAQSTAQTTDEEAKALDVIDSAQLDRREVYSVAEAARFVPGLRVEQVGGPGSFTRILTRGLPPYHTALLIDGFRFRDAASTQGDAEGFVEDLLIIDTDRIEVLRGSGSSLYGTNASGGVINVITAHGGGAPHGEVLAEGGGLGLVRGSAKVGGGLLNDRLEYSGGVGHLNVLTGLDGNDRARNTSGQGSLLVHFTPSLELSGRLWATDSFAQLNVSPYALSVPATSILIPAVPGVTFQPSQDDPDSRRAGHYFSSLVALSQRVSQALFYRVAYQGVVTSRDNRDGPLGPGYQPAFSTSSRYDGRIDTLQVRVNLRAGSSQLIAGGYEFERESLENRSRDTNPNSQSRVDADSSASQRSNAIFFEDQITLARNRLHISLSGRVQQFTLDRPAFSGGTALYAGVKLPSPAQAHTGDASLAYLLPSSGTKLRAHVGNGYRIASLYERFGNSFYFGSFSPYGDPNLRPERLISVDCGIDQYLASSKARLSATYFYTHIQESIIFDLNITPPLDRYGRFGGYANAGGGLARGLEVGGELKATHSTELSASYTLTNAQERNSTVFGGSLRTFRVSKHAFTTQAVQQFGQRSAITFDLIAFSDYAYPLYVNGGSRNYQFPGPVKVNLAAHYTVPLSDRHSLRFYVRAENLFDRTYYEDGFRTPGVWGVGGLKFMF